ncbi:MAG: 3-dehydroquinate synthase [Phycisphaerales bacterium]|nr:3-dehydroquinate synthase [Phycisphaerales bacterium]
MRDYTVQVGGEQSRVVVGRGLLPGLGALITSTLESADPPASFLAIDSTIREPHGALAMAGLGAMACGSAEVDARESAKVTATVESLWDAMLKAGLDRRGLVVGLGGGIVGDVVGFAAASWMRGVQLVLVPTTLLAMVDASIGGKTGVNVRLPDGGLGKNLAGAFWPARLIVSDIDTLSTLDDRDFRCGLAECVKHAVLDGEEAMERLDGELDSVLARDPETLEELVARSGQVKCAVVERDPREAGGRALLNLGHTYAHALESREELDLRHGEAVAIGLMAACGAAKAAGLGDGRLAGRVETLLERAGLPVRLADGGSLAVLRAGMQLDKKRVGGRLQLILPVEAGDVRVVDAPAETVIEEGWRAVGAG